MQLRALVLPVLVALVLAAPAEAKKGKKKAEEAPSVAVERWLVLGPAAHPLPVFHDDDEAGYDIDAIKGESFIDVRELRPAAGQRQRWFGAESLDWETVRGKSVDLDDGEGPAVAWLASYLRADDWQKATLKIDSEHPTKVWVDGVALADSGEIVFEERDALLVIQSVHDPEVDADWELSAKLEGKDAAPGVRADTAPTRGFELRDIIDAPSVDSLAVSPDGSEVATTVRRIVPGTHDRESWVEIRSTNDGRLLSSWRGRGGAQAIAWSPDGRWLSYRSSTPGKSETPRSDLMLLERASGSVRVLMSGVERMGGYSWSPDAKAIVFSTTREGKAFKDGIKRLEGLRDRWSNFRNRRQLHLVSVPDGTQRRLTAGEWSTNLTDIAPDGKSLLFTRQLDDVADRPYTRTELWQLDLTSFEASKLRDFRWFGGAEWGPRGEWLLVGAQAAEWGDVGENVPEGMISNSYDGQRFLWNPTTDQVNPITRDFDPSVQSSAWSRADGKIYWVAEDRDYQRLYRFDPESGSVVEIETPVDAFAAGFSLAAAAPVLVGTGSSMWQPQQMIAVDLEDDEARTLEHPNDDWFANVRGGDAKAWSFRATNGSTIDGRYYLPPDFDASKKYPLIVYYYGGTSPVGRGFGGRYPKEWWAAQGYVVYVLQPSGATGFGQEFAARHVNDWGKTTSDEIIEGTKKFLATHTFADAENVGCIGASYGGFMTMLLTTRSDIFSAAVAHAGISSISSYWGEGYWGYLYSSVASAEAFPWNREDVYVDQSPLFRADENRVPILLTHGTDDTNVPVGESDQFYVALKLLGKEVEYLQVEGQDHWIVDHAKRQLWSRSILAWFDRHLKDDAARWDAMYGED